MEHPAISTEEKREEEVIEEEQQPVDRPDAKKAAGVEVGIKARGGAGVEDDSGDEESREDKEETNAAPSPDDESLQKRTLEAGMAMIEDYGEDGDAAKSIKGRDEGGQPRRAQAAGRNGAASCGGRWSDCRWHYREIPSTGELAEA